MMLAYELSLSLLAALLAGLVAYSILVAPARGSDHCLLFGSSEFTAACHRSILNLKSHESTDIYRIALGKTDTCATFNNRDRVITVSCDTTLSGIKTAIGDDQILRKENNEGVWFLNSSIVVSRGAILTIDSNDTTWLKISSDGISTGIRGIQSETQGDQTTPYLIQIFGALYLDGVNITSWDPVSNDYKRQISDGSVKRPYITFENGADPSHIINSEIAYMGYKSVRKQGLNFYGGDGSILIGNRIHHLWFGFYSDGASNITIKNNQIYANTKYGLDPHSGTHNLLISNNRVHDNGHIGIICSADCTNIMIESNTIFNNTNAGIMVSKNVQDSTVRNNSISDENTGISVSESVKNAVYRNNISDSTNGIQVKLMSSNNSLYENSVYNTQRCGIEVSEASSNNRIYSNAVRNSWAYGVCLSGDPAKNTLSNNTIHVARGYAVYVKDSSSTDNLFQNNEVINAARTPIRISNGTLTVVNNTIQ